MAKVKFGALVSDVRGKLNGIVFARNASGPVVRNFTAPVNPATPAQTFIRNIFRTLTQNWKGLNNGQRQTFRNQRENYPSSDSLGNVVILTAQQLYMKHNMNLLTAGEAELVAQPAPIPIASLEFGNVEISKGADTLDVDSSVVPANVVLVIEATRDLSQGIEFVADSDFKQIKVLQAGTGGPALSLETEYATVFGVNPGNMAIGDKVFLRGKYISTITGQATAHVKSSGIVEA